MAGDAHAVNMHVRKMCPGLVELRQESSGISTNFNVLALTACAGPMTHIALKFEPHKRPVTSSNKVATHGWVRLRDARYVG